MSVSAKAAAADVKTWLARALLAVVALTVISYGSTSAIETNLAAFAFALLALASAWFPIGSGAIRRVHALGVLLLAGLVGFTLFQAAPAIGDGWANAVWMTLNERLGESRGSISVAPGMTIGAVTALAMPFLAFLCALTFFQNDEGAVALWRWLAHFGFVYAAFGIAQEIAFPDQLLLETKKYYLGALTATFVNRNSAGTFFGVAMLLNLSLAFHELKSINVVSLARKAARPNMGWRSKHGRFLFHAFASLVIAIALFLTQSRGAAGASAVAVIIFVAVSATRKLTADADFPALGRWRRTIEGGAAALLAIGVFALFAGRSAYRMQEQGSEDGRWCAFASTLEAIKDNGLWGSGFGAFRDVFPMYRNSDCAGIAGVWDRAHDFYLEGALGLGIVFVAAMTLASATLVWALAMGLRRRHLQRYVPAAATAILALAALHSVVDFSLQIPGVNVYFSCAMAAAITVSLGRGRASPTGSALKVDDGQSPGFG